MTENPFLSKFQSLKWSNFWLKGGTGDTIRFLLIPTFYAVDARDIKRCTTYNAVLIVISPRRHLAEALCCRGQTSSMEEATWKHLGDHLPANPITTAGPSSKGICHVIRHDATGMWHRTMQIHTAAFQFDGFHYTVLSFGVVVDMLHHNNRLTREVIPTGR